VRRMVLGSGTQKLEREHRQHHCLLSETAGSTDNMQEIPLKVDSTKRVIRDAAP